MGLKLMISLVVVASQHAHSIIIITPKENGVQVQKSTEKRYDILFLMVVVGRGDGPSCNNNRLPFHKALSLDTTLAPPNFFRSEVRTFFCLGRFLLPKLAHFI